MAGHIDLAGLTERLAERLLRGRKVVLITEVLAGATSLIPQLRRYGASRPLVVATQVGTGALPEPADAEIRMYELPPARTISEGIRQAAALVETPPPEVVAAIEAYDPEGVAVCLVGPFATARSVAGRPVLDGRFAAWAALEDKTLVDELFDAARVPRPPCMVVPATEDALRTAAEALDAGQGTVLAGDTAGGVNGGADLVRRVGPDADANAIMSLFAHSCRRVRVAPFLEGVPCSVHGIVAPDGVAALRPVEMVILRGPSPERFTYCGTSTWWDPPASDRAAIQQHARRLGALLAERVGFRGGFSLDGVLTANGFLATEVNPRFTGGLLLLASTLPDLPMLLIQAALVSGIDLGISIVDLAAAIAAAADDRRDSRVMGLSSAVNPTETTTVEVAGGAGRVHQTTNGDHPTAVLQLGPAAVGGMVRLVAPELLSVGERAAPYAVSALRLADDLWNTGFGRLEAAPDVRLS